MSQNIDLMNAVYLDVPAVMLPVQGGGHAIFADPSETTATAADVAEGKTFLNAQGELTTGTANVTEEVHKISNSIGRLSVSSSGATAIPDISLTVSKDGEYTIHFSCYQSPSTSGYQIRVYKNGSYINKSSGSFSSGLLIAKITKVNLNENDVLTLRAYKSTSGSQTTIVAAGLYIEKTGDIES